MKSSSEGAFHAMGITYVNMIKVKKNLYTAKEQKEDQHGKTERKRKEYDIRFMSSTDNVSCSKFLAKLRILDLC